MKRIVIAGIAGLLVAGAHAQTASDNRAYAEVGYLAISHEENALGYFVKSTPKALRGVLGYEVNDNVALEVMAAAGLGYSDADVNAQSTPGIQFKVNSLYGWYVTPKTQLIDNVEGFVRLGYAHVRGTSTLGDNSSSDYENGFSYGLGLRYRFDRTTFLNVDYMSYSNKSDYKAKGLTVGLGFNF
jgi:opacity protein-like surface antigen